MILKPWGVLTYSKLLMYLNYYFQSFMAPASFRMSINLLLKLKNKGTDISCISNWQKV